MRKTCLLLFVLIIVPIISQAIGELNPKNAKVYYNQGIAWYNKGDYDRAISDFNKAIELNSKHPDAYNNRGIAWYDKGDHGLAISDFSKAIELNPRYADAYGARGNAWIKKGDDERAASDYNKAIELNPKLVEAYKNQGNTWYRKKKKREYVGHYYHCSDTHRTYYPSVLKCLLGTRNASISDGLSCFRKSLRYYLSD